MRYKISKKKWFGWRGRLVACLLIVALVAGILASSFFRPPKASAAISYLGQSTNSSSTAAGALTVTVPAGVATGNVLVAQVIALPGTSNATTITAPTGWSLIGTSPTSGKYIMSLYYHIVASGDPTSYTFSFLPNSTAIGGIAAFSGVNTKSPIDVTASQANGSTTSHTAPSVTASYSTAMVVPFWGFASNSTASSIDASLTSIWNTSNTVDSGIASGYKLLTNAGSTGTFTATTTASTASLAQTIALAPATAAAGVQFVAATAPAACTTSCTSMTEAAPTGYKANDLLVTNITWNGSVTLTAPSGWTQINSNIVSGTYVSADFYHYIASGDPSSYTWTFSGTGPSSALVSTVEFQGIDQTSPIDVDATSVDASGTSHNSPTVTTTLAQDMLYTSYGFTGSVSVGSFTSSETQIWNASASTSNGVVSIFGAYELQGLAGTTVTKNATTNHNVIALMHSIAIKPALPAPQLITPANGAHLTLLPTLQLVSATLTGSPLKYLIYLCSAANCPSGTIINTYDQRLSQVGWSGQDANSGTAYIGSTSVSSSTTATYTVQTALTPCTTYYWRGQGYDTSTSQLYNTSVSWSFNTSCVPSAPTLFYPSSSLTGVRLLPEFRLASTDLDADYLRYKIQLCSDSACATVLNTWDQTTSQANWTGQDAQSFTAYTADTSSATNSIQAYYTTTSRLAPSTIYYWRAYATDPGGTNTWSTASSIQAFTTASLQTNILNGQIRSGKIL